MSRLLRVNTPTLTFLPYISLCKTLPRLRVLELPLTSRGSTCANETYNVIALSYETLFVTDLMPNVQDISQFSISGQDRE